MKIILDQLAELNPYHIRVAEELQKRHTILYWIRIEEWVPLDKSRFPGTIFHNYHDVVRNIPPPEVDISGFEPWGRDEIVRFSAWEGEMLSMMDKWYPAWPVNQRKEFYYDMLQYWGGIIDRYAPEAIVFNAPPHQMFNLVLFAIAKERGIKTVVFDTTFRRDRIIAYKDYRVGNEVLARESKRGFGEKAVSFDDLKLEMKKYYTHVSQSANPTPAYVGEFMRMHEGWGRLLKRMRAHWPHVKDGSIIERAVLRVFKMIKPDLKDIYHTLQRKADFGRPYVYVPLNFQPEGTTSPQGGIYVDQLLMIKTLAAALPEGWELYVKEHPGQWKINAGDFVPFRYQGFYEEIARLPGVRIVPVATSTFELCDHAKATATVTGTAAWESILRGKCALIFGYPFFMQAPGIIRVGSVSDCRTALEKIRGGLTPRKEELFKYLALLDQVIVPGSLTTSGQPVDMESSLREEQWRYMHRAIEDALADT